MTKSQLPNKDLGIELPVKSTSWLIKEEQSRPCQDLKSNADSSPLSTTNPTQMPIPNHGVGTILKPHLHDGALHQRPLLRPRHLVRQPQPRRVGYRLPHRQRADQVVILCHIGLKRTGQFISPTESQVSESS